MSEIRHRRVGNQPLFAALAGVLASLSVAGCPRSQEPNPEHCSVRTGASFCAAEYAGERPYCTVPMCDSNAADDGEGFHGCVAEPPIAECDYACGGDANVLEDDSCVATGDGDPTGDGDGDPMGDGDGDDGCFGDADCSDPIAPFCAVDTGQCVDCEAMAKPDQACAELDVGAPVCEGGACVACAEGKTDACMETTPICELDTNSCMGCSEHEQCPDSACNMETGACIGADKVVHVNGTQPCNGGDGSEDAPHCTIGDALTAMGEESGVILLHAVDGNPLIYLQSNTVTNSLVILAAPDEEPIVTGAPGTAAFTVSTGGSLAMQRVTISGTQDGGRGVVVDGGDVRIERSRITNNTGGGILVAGGGSVIVTNSFLGGAGANNVDVLEVIDGSVNLSYSTVAAGFAASAAIKCAANQDVGIRNSLLIAATDEPEIQCESVVLTACATEMPYGDGDSLALGDMSAAWFIEGGFNSGDFHLSDNFPAGLATAAVWNTGDPSVDIDGDPRPTTPGTLDFAGADRP